MAAEEGEASSISTRADDWATTRRSLAVLPIMRPTFRPPLYPVPQGASTTLVCALAPDVAPGKFYHNARQEKRWVHRLAYSPELGRELWSFTEEVIRKAEAR